MQIYSIKNYLNQVAKKIYRVITNNKMILKINNNKRIKSFQFKNNK